MAFRSRRFEVTLYQEPQMIDLGRSKYEYFSASSFNFQASTTVKIIHRETFRTMSIAYIFLHLELPMPENRDVLLARKYLSYTALLQCCLNNMVHSIVPTPDPSSYRRGIYYFCRFLRGAVRWHWFWRCGRTWLEPKHGVSALYVIRDQGNRQG